MAMSDREKLIELVNEAWHGCNFDQDCSDCEYANCTGGVSCVVQFIANYLISNGVTMQKWIPVSERLPEEEGWYWVFTTPDRGYRSINKGEFRKGYHWNNFTPYWRGAGGTWTNVTHWREMPEPPKECE